ncbi:MAG: pyridoxamine 5'-phosphate oxidase family protein [Hyphomicrobiales bacterium]|nr:pyridoxamine 5'-phosphate oxidase family protein [Hyphomicrobiales bacterium]
MEAALEGEVDDDLRRRIAAFLDTHHVLSLATRGPDGPHAANLFYARDGFRLFWVSDSASRHSQHLAAEARVAATIAPDYQDFAEIRGLQLLGTAHCLDNPGEVEAAQGRLAQRYRFLRDVAALPEAVRNAFASARVYRLDPREIVLIDNTRGFGAKETLTLAAPPQR